MMNGQTSAITAHLSRKSLGLLAIIIILPWVLTVGFLFPSQEKRIDAEQDSAPKPASVARTYQSKPGPWGKLTYTPILTEPPEDQFNTRYTVQEHFIWTFEDYDQAKLAALWREAGLGAEELEIINDPELRQIEGPITKIAAPREFVRGLSRPARTVIYTALSHFSDNAFQVEPFRFRAAVSNEWFEDSGLKPETIAAISALLYRRGNSVLFSDPNLVMVDITSTEERLNLIKTLARKSTMLVSLHISPDSDIDALADYWGHGTRSKDIKPLLQSLQRKRADIAVDIIHLLPPFARTLLYTYPSPEHPGNNSYMDCHWSSLNFFNPTPDPRYEDIAVVIDEITRNYHVTTGASKIGDLVLLGEANGDVIHSCVYIADNIVFTKNGSASSAPWILMNLEDVIAFYSTEKPLDVQRYRRKVGTGL